MRPPRACSVPSRVICALPVSWRVWPGSTVIRLSVPISRSAAFCAVPAVNDRPAPLRRVTAPLAASSCCKGGNQADNAPCGSSPLASARAAARSTCSSGIATSTRAPSTTVTPSRPITLYCLKPVWNRLLSSARNDCTATSRCHTVPTGRRVPAGTVIAAVATLPAV
ncbi:hypothetical protein D3C71_1002400 [compost metagenome]